MVACADGCGDDFPQHWTGRGSLAPRWRSQRRRENHWHTGVSTAPSSRQPDLAPSPIDPEWPPARAPRLLVLFNCLCLCLIIVFLCAEFHLILPFQPASLQQSVAPPEPRNRNIIRSSYILQFHIPCATISLPWGINLRNFIHNWSNGREKYSI